MFHNRTFIVFISSFVLSIAASINFNCLLPITLSIFLIAICIFILAFLFTRFRALCILLAIVAALCGNLFSFYYQAAIVESAHAHIGKTEVIQGIILQDPEVYDDSQRVLLKAINDENTFRVLCYVPLTEDALQPGDGVTVQAEFYGFTNAEGFDRETYRASQGVYVGASFVADDNGNAKHFEVTKGEGSAFLRYPNVIRSHIKESVLEYLPEREGGLLLGILIGDKTSIVNSDYQAFQKSGLSHIIVVSGLHIGFLLAFCNILLGKRWGCVLSVFVLLLFIPIVGATPSVIRASVMYLVSAAAFMTSKKQDTLQALFFALFLLILQNPYCIFGVGLQLSFASTLGLLLYASRLERLLFRPFQKLPAIIRKIVRVVVTAIACSICANLFTIPIVLSSFGYVSILSFFANVLVTGVVAVCFIGGILLTLVALFSSTFSKAIAAVLLIFLRYMLFIANKIAAFAFATVSIQNKLGIGIIFLCVLWVFLWIYKGKSKRVKRVLLAALPCFVLLIGINSYQQKLIYHVTYLPAGNGQSIIISYGQEELIIIDCSASGHKSAGNQILEWMSWNGFDHIDSLILTAVDKGHARDFVALTDAVEVNQIVVPSGYKTTKYNGEIVTQIESLAEITTKISEQTSLGSHVSVNLFFITEGKIGVQIDSHTLVMHSPTVKQLTNYVEKNETPQAQTLVLSTALWYDTGILNYLMEQSNAAEIIVASGVQIESEDDTEVTLRTTYQEGEIVKQYHLSGS